MSEIMVVGETKGGHPDPVTWELLTLGQRLGKDSGLPLSLCLIGNAVRSASQEAIQRGADRVYVVEDGSLSTPNLELYSLALERVVSQTHPALVLMGHTPLGKELGPYVAACLKTGVVTNCLDVRSNKGADNVEVECPVFGGSARSVYKFGHSRPCIATLQTRLFDPSPSQPGRSGTVLPIEVPLKGVSPRTKVVSKEAITGPRLEDAAIIVSGGKGLRKKENYKYVEELADLLGGLPGASRAITDEKWTDTSRWIGLTGKTVAPNLYIAVGISGAPQHMAGCSKSRAIVVINNDKDAGIFRYARYGVEADCLEFLPAFIEKCREMKKS